VIVNLHVASIFEEDTDSSPGSIPAVVEAAAVHVDIHSVAHFVSKEIQTYCDLITQKQQFYQKEKVEII